MNCSLSPWERVNCSLSLWERAGVRAAGGIHLLQRILDTDSVVEKLYGMQLTVENLALAIFKRGQEVARKAGLILVDTKYEFGLIDGKLAVIDEIHTPDSSRYWQADSYAHRFASGQEPDYFDKEFLRLWFKEHSNPYSDKVLPEGVTPTTDRITLLRYGIADLRLLMGADLRFLSQFNEGR